MCRGVRSVLFYSLPLHAPFFSELCNFVEDAAASQGQVEVLFTEFDFLMLSRIVGQSRAQHMIADSAASFLFT